MVDLAQEIHSKASVLPRQIFYPWSHASRTGNIAD
jgi:hypothetical protein